MTNSKPTIHAPFGETATLLFADVVDSMRLLEHDEARTVVGLNQVFEKIAERTMQVNARMLERRGDGVLIEARDVDSAVSLATFIHVQANGARQLSDGLLAFRIGIHVCSVVHHANDVYGRGSSIAARITAEAMPEQTLLSLSARDCLRNAIGLSLRDVGEVYLKNVEKPMRLFAVDSRRIGAHTPLPKPPTPKQFSVVALPPDELTLGAGAGGNGYGEVFSDLLTQALSSARTFSVISRLTARALQGTCVTPSVLREQLSIDYAVSGQWRRINASTRLVVLELVDCESSRVLWSIERRVHDEEVVDPAGTLFQSFASLISSAIASHEIAKARVAPLSTVATHSLLLSSISLMHRFGREDFDAAKSHMEVARNRCGRHPIPHAWLARWHTLRIVQGWADVDRRDHVQAMRCSEKALALDDSIALVHTVAGSVALNVRRDPDAALQSYERALSIDPHDSLAWALKAAAHSLSDDGKAAFDAAKNALALSPLDPMRYLHESLAASACLSLGDFRQAYAFAESSIRANRAHHSTLRVAAIACELLGDHVRASAYVKELLVALPSYRVKNFLEANPFAEVSATRRRFADALQRAGVPA